MTYLHLSIHFFLSLTSVGNLNKLHVCFPPVRCVQPIAKQYTIAQECCYERWCTRKLENESESKRDLQTLLSLTSKERKEFNLTKKDKGNSCVLAISSYIIIISFKVFWQNIWKQNLNKFTNTGSFQYVKSMINCI